MLTTYAQLNIGRNVGDSPMTDAQWTQFVSEAQGILKGCSIVVGGLIGSAPHAPRVSDTQVMRGSGAWNGVAEESAYISLYWENGISVDMLKHYAKRLAARFEQDAIAVITGSELISPKCSGEHATFDALLNCADCSALINDHDELAA